MIATQSQSPGNTNKRRPTRREPKPPKPTIGIIGQGNVGTALAEGLERSGYEVRTAGRDAELVRRTAEWADVLFLAVPYAERENAVQEMGWGTNGKVLVDVTNALAEDGSFIGSARRSGAEELQEAASEADVVKAFNTVFAKNMASGEVSGERLSLLVAADGDAAKRKVLDIGAALGFDPVDAGPLRNARSLESLGFLNIQLGYAQGMGPDIGFKVVH